MLMSPMRAGAMGSPPPPALSPAGGEGSLVDDNAAVADHAVIIARDVAGGHVPDQLGSRGPQVPEGGQERRRRRGAANRDVVVPHRALEPLGVEGQDRLDR